MVGRSPDSGMVGRSPDSGMVGRSPDSGMVGRSPDSGMSGRVAALVSGQLTSRGGVAQQVSQGHQPASWGDGERLGLGREKGGDLSA